MNVLRQVLGIAAINLRAVPIRLGSSLVIVVGLAGAVGVLTPIMAMSIGFKSAIMGDARADRAIVLSRVSTDEEESTVSRDDFANVMNSQEVRHDTHGGALVSEEVVLQALVSRKRDHSDVGLTLRGVGSRYLAVRPELHLVGGRMFQSGKSELLVGAAAQARFEGLEIGDNIRLQNGDWTIVGIYSGGKGSRESEIIADVQTVMAAYKLKSYNSISVVLNTPARFAGFRREVVSDTKARLDVRTEAEYLASDSGYISRMMHIVAYSIGTIMSLGALFGALNSMYSALTTRGTEMATLRAIGFSGGAVSAALLIEALLLALLGAAIGLATSYAIFAGQMMNTLGGSVTGSQLVFSLPFTPALMIGVVASACAIGLIGGLLPAVRVARSSIAAELQDS
jgi:putative ABC transport system permease protein